MEHGTKHAKITLGRGLGSLLGDDAVLDDDLHRIRQVAVYEIRPNPRQPRKRFDPAALGELAESIREQGVIQPVLARLVADPAEPNIRYELVAGERRWRAAQEAGLREIPVMVKEMDDQQSLEISLLENLQREDLNPLETARGYQQLLDEFGYNHKRLAKRVGISREAVSNALRLLKLPGTVTLLVEEGQISAGHARALLALAEQPEAILELANRVVAKQLSVRETERLARVYAMADQSDTLDPSPRKGSEYQNRREPAIEAMEKQLISELQTRVTITHARGRGKIILEYTNLEELQSLTGRLLQMANTLA